MSIVYHERPGVYSDYEASGILAAGSGKKTVALVGLSEAEAGVYTVTSQASLAALGETNQLADMARLALANGAGLILAAPAAADTVEAYTAAWKQILQKKEAALIAIGSEQEAVQLALKEAVETVSGQNRECVALLALNQPEWQQLTARAKAINSERVVLLGPTDGCGAAALAGILAAQTDPALPLNGVSLKGVGPVTATYTETELDGLITGGVTVLETVGGRTEIIRGVTTRSLTGGEPDSTWRELSTILIVDDVIPAVRTALRTKFSRAKNNRTTREAIRSQVVVELEDRLNREIIDSYDNVTASALESDPTVCQVSFDFTVTRGLNRIYLTAHITV